MMVVCVLPFPRRRGDFAWIYGAFSQEFLQEPIVGLDVEILFILCVKHRGITTCALLYFSRFFGDSYFEGLVSLCTMHFLSLFLEVRCWYV